MQLCNAEVHVEVLGVVATVAVRHTYRNLTGQFFRFLYDVCLPTRAHLARVEARVAGQWVMRSAVAPKEVRPAPGDDEPPVKYTPGLWPHAHGSGCFLVLDAPPEETEEVVVMYTYAQPLDVEVWSTLQGLIIPCQVVCPGATEGDLGALPPDSALTVHLWDAQCVPQLRTHTLKEIRCGAGRKFVAALGGMARHLLLEFSAIIEHQPTAILQSYAPASLPARPSDPLAAGPRDGKPAADWPVASLLTFCPVLSKTVADSSVLFLLDCSAEASLHLFCQATRQALLGLPTTCTFNVVVMQAAPKCLFPAPQKADSEHIGLAVQFLQALQPVPSTNVYDALALALEGTAPPADLGLCHAAEAPALPAPHSAALATTLTELFIFLGSPVPDLEDCCALLARHANHARLFATAHGALADGQAAKELSRAAHGLFELPDSADWGIVRLADKLQEWMDLVAQPSCVNVTVEWEAPFSEVTAPSVPPVLFHHQPCTLLALHRMAPAKLAELQPGQAVCTLTAHWGAGPPQSWRCTVASVAPVPGYSPHTIAAAQVMRSLPAEKTEEAQALAFRYALHSPWTCLTAQFSDEAETASSAASSVGPTADPLSSSGAVSPEPPSASEGEDEARPVDDVEDDANAGRDNPFDALKDVQEDEDLYEVLGVDPTATTGEIRKQFKRLAVQHHPDKNPGDAAALFKFQQILRAYEILQDEERRAIYDAYGVTRPNVKIVFKPQSPGSAAKAKGRPPPKPRAKRANRSAAGPAAAAPAPPPPAGPLLLCAQPPPTSESSCGLTASEADSDGAGASCGGSPSHSVADGAPEGPRRDPVVLWKVKDVRCRARFALEKVANGCVGNLNVNIQRLCNQCRGTGNQLRGWALAQCPKCLGVGRVARLLFAPDGGVVQEVGIVPCSGCQGDGYVLVPNPALSCGGCQGAGYRSYAIHLNISIGAGIQEEEQIVLKGFIGSPSPLVLPGDAVITVQIAPSPPFQQAGCDLHAPLNVSLRTALCGGSVQIPLLGHPQPLVLPVPERLLSLLPDMQVCLPFHGLPAFRRPGVRGHLVLHCAVLFPTRLPQLVRERLAAVMPPTSLDLNCSPSVEEDITAHNNEKENVPKPATKSACRIVSRGSSPKAPNPRVPAIVSPRPPAQCGAAKASSMPASPASARGNPKDPAGDSTSKVQRTTSPSASRRIVSAVVDPPTRFATTTTITRVHLNGMTEVNKFNVVL
eukprot:EG_transcript_537